MPAFFLHVTPVSGSSIYWRERQGFGGVSIHINFSYLAQLLGDTPPPGTTLVSPENYATGIPGVGTVQVQPFVEVVDGAMSALPPGPSLQSFLNDPLRNQRRMGLSLPIYDPTLGIGDSGGGYLREMEDSRAFHGGWDVAPRSQNDEGDLFEVCAAASGHVEGIGNGPNSTIVLRHTVGGADFLTIYQHLNLSGCPLKKGAPVRRGQFLARIDQRAVPAGTRQPFRHLHFMAACGVDIPGSSQTERLWFAIDSFGIYDYYRNSRDREGYNYLPDLSPDCFKFPIRGAEHQIQWARESLLQTLPVSETTEHLRIIRMQFRTRRHAGKDGVPPDEADQCLVWLEGTDDFFFAAIGESHVT